MVRFIGSSFFGLGLVAIDSNQQATSFDSMDNTEKRRQLNVQAAKKSYEIKKKMHSDLIEKNTQLQEDQKQLLHDKSRLEGRIQKLEQVLKSLVHVNSSCFPETNVPQEKEPSQADEDEREGNCEDRLEVSNSSEESHDVLDLTVNGPNRATNSAEIPKVNSTEKESVLFIAEDAIRVDDTITPTEDLSVESEKIVEDCRDPTRNSVDTNETVLQDGGSQWDEHILDSSSLGIGATQEVVCVPSARKGGRSAAFGPHERNFSHKAKRVKGSTKLRGCGADALKSHRSHKVTNHFHDRFSAS